MHRYRLSYQQYSIDNLSDAFGSRIPLNESDIFAGKRYIYIYIYIGGVTVSCVQAARNARTSNPCRGMLEFATGCWPRQTRTAIAPIFPFFQANASIFLPALLIGRPRSEAFRSFSRHLEKVTGNGESREGKSRGQLFRSRSTPRHSRFHEFLPYLPSNALLSLSFCLSFSSVKWNTRVFGRKRNPPLIFTMSFLLVSRIQSTNRSLNWKKNARV